MNLDELEAKARAAKEAREKCIEAHQMLALCRPDTILDLVERVRAGEECAGTLYDFWSQLHDQYCGEAHSSGCRFVKPGALERMESLAHSPQEAV